MAKAAKKAKNTKGAGAATKKSSRPVAKRSKSSAAAQSAGASRTSARTGESGRVAEHGARVREQVRVMTSSALRGETPTPEQVGGLLRDVMGGTVEAIDRALPEAFRSDKLREAVDRFAQQFERIAHEAKVAGTEAVQPMMNAARAAGEHPFAAMQDSLRSGMRAATGATSRLMSATGGAISGMAEGLAHAAEERERKKDSGRMGSSPRRR